jgi:hypothetical protein
MKKAKAKKKKLTVKKRAVKSGPLLARPRERSRDNPRDRERSRQM